MSDPDGWSKVAPIQLPPYNNIKLSHVSNKRNKKESLLLRNVYRNDLHTKMLLAKKRREDLIPSNQRSEGKFEIKSFQLL